MGFNQAGRARVGARSALFAPIQTLDHINDEEHEASYKKIRPDAITREVVRWRVLAGAALVLMVLQQLESLEYRTASKLDGTNCVADREFAAVLPQVQVVDMASQSSKTEANGLRQQLC